MRNLLLQRGDSLSIKTLLTLARTTSLESGHSEEALALKREASIKARNARLHASLAEPRVDAAKHCEVFFKANI